MKGEYSIERRRIAESRRQAVLDWLHANPASRMAAIIAALPKHNHKSLVGTVTRMRMAGEISAVGKLREYIYTAVATITATAESMIATNNASRFTALCKRTGRDPVAARKTKAERYAAAAANRSAGKIAQEAERIAARERRAQSKPGHYIHTPGTDPHTGQKSTPNHGGQGALRNTVYISCHQSYRG